MTKPEIIEYNARAYWGISSKPKLTPYSYIPMSPSAQKRAQTPLGFVISQLMELYSDVLKRLVFM